MKAIDSMDFTTDVMAALDKARREGATRATAAGVEWTYRPLSADDEPPPAPRSGAILVWGCLALLLAAGVAIYLAVR